MFSSAPKVLLTIFWDSEGVVHIEFLEQGNTVNSTKYVNALEKLKARLRRVWSEKVSIIHHDNARPHTSSKTRTALDRLGLRTLPHPPYSPDLCSERFLPLSKTQGLPQGQPLLFSCSYWVFNLNNSIIDDNAMSLVFRRLYSVLCVQLVQDY